MSETMLMIGGPIDGMRVQIDGRPKVYFVVKANRLGLNISSPRDEQESRYMREVTEEYVRVEGRVYAHYSIAHLDVIDLLASGYRCEIGK
jgi:hypothetical protein